MKSTLLKTLAATSLVATTQAEIQVLGASFKERGVDAPLGTIIPDLGKLAATRGYLIMDDTVLTAAPNKATYIEYGEIREAGVVTRYYTVDTDFADFKADGILGSSGGRHIYGHMHAPVLVADVPNALIPFSGTAFSSGFPRKLVFDQTAFQIGASDAVTGPQIVMAGSSIQRSLVSGSANPVNVGATTIVGATQELVARLVKKGYVKSLGEAPEITSTFPASVPLADGATQILTLTLDPDSFPTGGDTFDAPTYQWYKDNVAIPAAVLPTFTLTGGASTAGTGSGTYKVVATNALGFATSTNVVVTSVANTITTNLTPAIPLAGANSTILSVVLSPTSVTPPTYQWFKNNVAIAAVDGGTAATYTVTGGTAGITGSPAGVAYTFRVEITNSAGTVVSGNSVVTVTDVAMSFTTQMPTTLAVSFSGTATLAPVPIVNALPKVTTYQWMKAPLASPAAFANVATGDGGQAPTLTVNGNNASATGPGVYRLTIGNGVTTLLSGVCTVTAAP